MSTAQRLAQRFSPDGSSVLEPDGALRAFVPVPLRLLPLMRLPAMPARATAISWLAFLAEVEDARREETHATRTIPVSYLPSDGFRRGGTRAIREICRIIAATEATRANRLFAEPPAVHNGSVPLLSWRIGTHARSSIESSFRLDRRNVAPFFRIELATAMYARTRWTMPVYAAIGRRIIAERSKADIGGWVTLSIPLRDLASELDWHGRQFKDFRPKVLQPALQDLGIDDISSPACPSFLDLRSEEHARGILRLSARRVGRTGLPLDSPFLQARLKAIRGRLGDLPSGGHRQEEAVEPTQPLLRQGIVW